MGYYLGLCQGFGFLLIERHVLDYLKHVFADKRG